jgi:hypothetical protein
MLGYDASLVPDGGSAVIAKTTALSRSYGKDAAGHLFHIVALKQAGLFGAWARHRHQPGAAVRFPAVSFSPDLPAVLL